MTDSPSMFPKQEVIIDPLYEPLQLNRYELCPHLKMLSNVSHLRYGISPYLLFDVCKMKEIMDELKYPIGLENEDFQKHFDRFQELLKIYIFSLKKLDTDNNENEPLFRWNDVLDNVAKFNGFFKKKYGVAAENIGRSDYNKTITVSSLNNDFRLTSIQMKLR